MSGNDDPTKASNWNKELAGLESPGPERYFDCQILAKVKIPKPVPTMCQIFDLSARLLSQVDASESQRGCRITRHTQSVFRLDSFLKNILYVF